MKKYELLYIIPSRFTDAEISKIQENTAGMIQKLGGAIFRNETLSKIKLSYPIKNEHYGTYVLVYFESEPEAVNKLNELLRLDMEVLRHVIEILPKGAEDRKFEIVAYAPPLSAEGKTEHGTKFTRKTFTAPVISAAPLSATPISEEEIDKKLDEMFDKDLKLNV